MKDNLKSHIVNLYILALSDGDFAKEELDVILKIAEDKGFSKTEFEQIIANPTAVAFHLPETFMDKIKLLFDFVKVILADNVIEEEEVVSFMSFCRKFEFGKEESKELFDWLVELGKQDISTDKLENEVQKLLNS